MFEQNAWEYDAWKLADGAPDERDYITCQSCGDRLPPSFLTYVGGYGNVCGDCAREIARKEGPAYYEEFIEHDVESTGDEDDLWYQIQDKISPLDVLKMLKASSPETAEATERDYCNTGDFENYVLEAL